MKNQSSQQAGLNAVMEHLKKAQELFEAIEHSKPQVDSTIYGDQYFKAKTNLEKSFGSVSRLWDMSGENPFVKI